MIPNSFYARIFTLGIVFFNFVHLGGLSAWSQEIAAFWEGNVITF
jgi:hypothetical protein